MSTEELKDIAETCNRTGLTKTELLQLGLKLACACSENALRKYKIQLLRKKHFAEKEQFLVSA